MAQIRLLDLERRSSVLIKSRGSIFSRNGPSREEQFGRQSPAESTEIIEEAPAPGLSAELKKDLAEKAVAAAKAVN